MHTTIPGEHFNMSELRLGSAREEDMSNLTHFDRYTEKVCASFGYRLLLKAKT